MSCAPRSPPSAPRSASSPAAPSSQRPEKMQQMLEIALGNTDRLVRLVNDILDLERISSGKSELQLTMCSLEDLLQRASALLHAAAARPTAGDPHPASPTQASRIWADPDRILQTLTNLISNAIKFSSPGRARSILRACTIDDLEESLEIEITRTTAAASPPTSSKTSLNASSRSMPQTPAPWAAPVSASPSVAPSSPSTAAASGPPAPPVRAPPSTSPCHPSRAPNCAEPLRTGKLWTPRHGAAPSQPSPEPDGWLFYE